jgi:hypothetical protein
LTALESSQRTIVLVESKGVRKTSRIIKSETDAGARRLALGLLLENLKIGSRGEAQMSSFG